MAPPLPAINDYLHPRIYQGLLQEIPLIQELIGVRDYFPVREVPGDRLIFDLVKHHAPLAAFTAPGAESPRLDPRPVYQQVSVDAAYVRSKVALRENDVRILRQFGGAPVTSLQGQMAQAARAKIADESLVLSQSVDRRMEKMCIDTLMGALTVTPASEPGVSEVSFTISYPVNTVQAGDAAGANNSKLWSDITSDPLADVQNWFQTLRYNMATMIVSRRVMNLLSRNTTLRGNILINTPVGQPTVLPQAAIQRFISSEMGLNVVVYDSQYTVRSWALSSNVLTPTDTAYRYLPDNKVIFLPAGPQGFFASSPAPQNDYQSGKFLFPLDPEVTGRKDPWIYEVVCGIYGLPVPEYPDRIYVATVAS